MTESYLKPGSSGALQEAQPVTTSAGAGSSGLIPALNSSGQLDSSFLPGASSFTASETITGPAAVNLFDSSGTMKVRNADAAGNKPVDGFAISSIATSSFGVVTTARGAIITGFTGLTDGTAYYLGAAGAITATPPAVGSGSTYQYVGKADGTTSLVFLPGPVIQR